MQNDEPSLQNQDAVISPPDWASTDKDLLCPLCEYDLRGLTEPRCPECGFKFTWRELLDAEKNKHPYLFEYGKGRNIRTLWKTFWRTCRPRRFWREVNPAQDVKPVRLILYWLISSCAIFLVVAVPVVRPVCWGGYQIFKFRADFTVPGSSGLLKPNAEASAIFGPVAITSAQLDSMLPPPWQSEFWSEAVDAVRRGNGRSGYLDHMAELATGWGTIYLAWPWLTLISLLIFRISMRQAKIKTSHVLRTVIYSCDFAILMVAVAIGIQIAEPPFGQGWLFVAMAAVCALTTSYRLTIAFQRYLRVHMPLATVLASQVITFLIVFVIVADVANFWRRI